MSDETEPATPAESADLWRRAVALGEQGDDAERRGDRAAAEEHHKAALRLLGTVFRSQPQEVVRQRIVYCCMQLARMTALRDGPDAEVEAYFCIALQLASLPADDRSLRAVVWHYVGAHCARRGLHVAAFLACQESVDARGDADASAAAELRQQVVALNALHDVAGMLALVAVLERRDALRGDERTIQPLADVAGQLLQPDAAREVLAQLADPARVDALREDTIARARAAVSDFPIRFVTGQLKLEETRSATLLTASRETETPLTASLDALGRALDAARAWTPGAEDGIRHAVRDIGAFDMPEATAYAWDRAGAYFVNLGRAGPSLLAYATALGHAERAEAEPTDPEKPYAAGRVKSALRGIAYAAHDLHAPKAQLAALALLERRGALDELPASGVALAAAIDDGVSRNALARDEECRRLIAETEKTVRGELPDFEQRFLAGELRFDSAGVTFDFLRTAVREERLNEVSARRAVSLYRRRWLHRLLWPALPVVVVATAWYIGGVPVRGVWLALTVVALGAYVVPWVAWVRAITPWVHASRIELEQWESIALAGRDASTHADAYRVLERFATDRAPFALLLRSFEPEASTVLTPEGVLPIHHRSREQRVRDALMAGTSPATSVAGEAAVQRYVVSRAHGSRESLLERYLAEHVAPRLPVVAVSNPAAPLPPPSGVPRLEIANDEWERAVRVLISAARFIVVECAVLAPGVIQELDLIRNRQREQDTVIVLPSDASVASVRAERRLTDILFGRAIAPTSSVASPEEAALRGFARVTTEDALVSGPPPAAVFDGLIGRA